MNNCVTNRVLLLALLLTTGSVGAATLDQTFMNDFQDNAMYFWSGDPSNMTLDGFSAGANMNGWKVDVSTPARMVLSGPTVAASAGRFNLLMNFKSTPFQLEWAEVFFNNITNVVLGFGTLSFNGGGWSNANVATHLIDIPLHPAVAAMPVPSSILLLMSALGLGTLTRVRQRAVA